MAELRVSTSRSRNNAGHPIGRVCGVWWMRLQSARGSADWMWLWNIETGWSKRWDNES